MELAASLDQRHQAEVERQTADLAAATLNSCDSCDSWVQGGVR